MKKLLIIFGLIIGITLNAQIPGTPDANGTITPGPTDWVTGLSAGDGEMKLQLDYLYDLNSINTIKAHITTLVSAAEASAWRNFTGFAKVASESNGDYFELLNDSTIVCRKAGMIHFGGCVHVQNNTGGGFTTYLVASRLYKNGTTEARCSQRAYGGDLRIGGEDVLSYNGTDNLALNDTVRLQYYTNNIDTEFYSNSIFTSPVAATIWLIYAQYE